jgi:hypothetical protein
MLRVKIYCLIFRLIHSVVINLYIGLFLEINRIENDDDDDGGGGVG